MKQFEYTDENEYIAAQCSANQRKFLQTWATKEEIKLIANVLKHSNPQSWICHGSRNGFEVEELRKYFPQADIIGTDIAPSAKSLPHMVCWDFSRYNEDWRNMDFIYSNSLDHARNPKSCLETWHKTLSDGGNLFINWSEHNYDVDRVDCFAASEEELISLLTGVGFTVKNVIHHSERTNPVGRVIRRFRNSILKRLGHRYFTSQEIPKNIIHAEKALKN